MNLKEMTDALLLWVSQWVGVTLPLVVTLVAGLMLCVAAATALWTRRIRVAPALLILFAGAFLVLISLDTRILHWLVATSYLIRIRLVMGLLSVLVTGVTFEAVRRSRLKERYAILWMFTGGVILLCAFFPAILEFLTALLGLQYVTAVGVVMFIFFLMVLFHISLALSNLQADETATAQRCALLEARLEKLAAELEVLRGGKAPVPAPVVSIPSGAPAGAESGRRTLRGFVVGVPLLIAAAALAVLWSGLRAPQAMVGDEVTHYYMLVHQAQVLPAATFQAHIPTGWGEPEVRRYPHANLWHYAGAWIYRALPSFSAIQIYQALFLVQLLVAAFFLIRRRPAATTPAILLYLLLLASLPITLMFSMTFYQDIPVTAQVVTAFCLLDRRRWVWATLFLMAALGLKETAVLFLPAFLLFLAIQRWGAARTEPRRAVRLARIALPLAAAGVLLWMPMKASDRLLEQYGGYYPFRELKSIAEHVVEAVIPPAADPAVATVAGESGDAAPTASRPVSKYEAEIIANHPGDLRQPRNWFVYGGVLIWLVMGLGLARGVVRWRKPEAWGSAVAAQWPLWVGLSFLLPTAWLLQTAPDARFFFPAVPFLLLPFVESFSRLPRQRIWMSLWVALAIVQSGFVLGKAVELRQVTPELAAGMAWLKKNPPPHNRVFMYPEGNYRLFPVKHDWYLKYRLRDFWRGSNDFRLQLLVKRKVGAIVVKKHLVGPVDEKITNLGVYPDYFVKEIAADPRFRKVFDNRALAVYEFDAAGLPLLD